MKKIERVQTGVRLEKNILKVLKGLAEYHEISLGDLLEGIILHSFENIPAFGDDSIETIKKLKKIYKLQLTHRDSHKLLEI